MYGASVLSYVGRLAELIEVLESLIGTLFIALFALLIVAAGPIMLVVSLREYRLVWTVLRTPTSDAGEARLSPSDGYVEVRGEVRPDETLEAPVSRDECVAYEYETEEYRGGGRSASWRVVDERTEATGFYVDDGTGRIYVDPGTSECDDHGNAELRLYDEEVIHVDGGDEPPEEVARFLAENDEVDRQEGEVNLGVVEIPKANDRRYKEKKLEPGDEVYVLGEVLRDDGANPESLVLTDGYDTPDFVVSDRSCTKRLSLRFFAKATGELIIASACLGVTYFFIYPYVRNLAVGLL